MYSVCCVHGTPEGLKMRFPHVATHGWALHNKAAVHLYHNEQQHGDVTDGDSWTMRRRPKFGLMLGHFCRRMANISSTPYVCGTKDGR